MYAVSFDMGTVTGACVITFEVGNTTIAYAMPDKVRWEYPAGSGNFGSEYSSVYHDMSGPVLGNLPMIGMGYMKGMIGGSFQENPNIPLSTAVGSLLTSASSPSDTSSLGSFATTIPLNYPNWNASTAAFNGLDHGVIPNISTFLSIYSLRGGTPDSLQSKPGVNCRAGVGGE